LDINKDIENLKYNIITAIDPFVHKIDDKDNILTNEDQEGLFKIDYGN
jgi:hypothetical protein